MDVDVRKNTRPLSMGAGMILFVLCVYLTAGVSLPNSSYEMSGSDTNQKRRVNTVEAPGLPVRLTGDIVPTEGGAAYLMLNYTIINLTPKIAEDFEVGLYVLNKKGRIKAGQVWRLPVEYRGIPLSIFRCL